MLFNLLTTLKINEYFLGTLPIYVKKSYSNMFYYNFLINNIINQYRVIMIHCVQ